MGQGGWWFSLQIDWIDSSASSTPGDDERISARNSFSAVAALPASASMSDGRRVGSRYGGSAEARSSMAMPTVLS